MLGLSHTHTHTQRQVADFLAPMCKICLIAANVEDIEEKRLRCSQGLCGFAFDRHKDYVALSRGLQCDCATDPYTAAFVPLQLAVLHRRYMLPHKQWSVQLRMSNN